MGYQRPEHEKVRNVLRSKMNAVVKENTPRLFKSYVDYKVFVIGLTNAVRIVSTIIGFGVMFLLFTWVASVLTVASIAAEIAILLGAMAVGFPFIIAGSHVEKRVYDKLMGRIERLEVPDADEALERLADIMAEYNLDYGKDIWEDEQGSTSVYHIRKAMTVCDRIGYFVDMRKV